MTKTNSQSKFVSKSNTRTLAKIAILAALSFVLMLVEFPLPIAPSFYKLDFSELGVLIGGFALGPIAGVAIEGLKVILNVIFTGTSTAGVGELANFVVGCSFVVPATLIYQHAKSRKSALIGMVVGTLCMALVGSMFNALVLLPMYSTLYQMPMDVLIGMGSAIVPAVHDVWTFALFCVVPFNLVKGVLVSVVTCLLYKHVSPILHS